MRLGLLLGFSDDVPALGCCFELVDSDCRPSSGSIGGLVFQAFQKTVLPG